MSATAYRLISLAATAVAASVLSLSACTVQSNDPDSSELVGAPEDGSTATNEDAITGTLAVGSTLIATADVNLRSGPSTSKSILHVIPNGSSVTVVDGTPQNGFYKVKHNGTTGWSYGKYFKAGASNWGSCSVNGTAGVCEDTGACGSGHSAHPGYCPGPSNIQCCTPDSSGGGGGGSTSSKRDAAIARAKSAMGFSYWWGHGRFRPEGPTSSNKGSCSGSCPSCSHSGSYGGDCSGLAAKVWEVPGSNSDLTVDSHPYSTANFVSDTSQWSTVSRSNVQKADAMVYNQSGEGHIFIYESGDGWGSMYAYECKGCSYGCVHDLRTASSAYHAIRRAGY
jgi:hypothetical protein